MQDYRVGARGGPGADCLRDGAGVARVGRHVLDDALRAGAARGGAAGFDLAGRGGPEVLQGRDLVQDGAVRDLTAQPQGARASRRREDLGRGGGRPAKPAPRRAARSGRRRSPGRRVAACWSSSMYSRSNVTGDSGRAPTWPIQSCTPWPTPTVRRPGNSRCSVAVSIAVSATFLSGTGSTPIPAGSRVVQASTAAAVAIPPPQKQSSQSHAGSSRPSSSAARATSRSRSWGSWWMHVWSGRSVEQRGPRV